MNIYIQVFSQKYLNMCIFCQMISMRHPEVQKLAIMLYMPMDDKVAAITRQVVDMDSIISSTLHDLCFIDNKWPCIMMNIKEYIMLNYDTEWLTNNYFFDTFVNEAGHIRKIVIKDTIILFGRYLAIADYNALNNYSWITVQKYIYGVTPILQKTLKAVNVSGLV